MDTSMAATALQKATPFKISDKYLGVIASAAFIAFMGYTIANYHYSIKLNKLRIEEEERNLDG